MKHLSQLALAVVILFSATDIKATTSADPLVLLQKNYPAVYNHLVHDFNKLEEVQFTTKEDVVYVSFKCNGQTVHSVYSINGELRHSVTYLGLALPVTISEQLKKEYPTFTIYYGKKIHVKKISTYEVVIENKEEYRLVNFRNGEMEETQRIKK